MSHRVDRYKNEKKEGMYCFQDGEIWYKENMMIKKDIK
jgi:hypothetical protein